MLPILILLAIACMCIHVELMRTECVIECYKGNVLMFSKLKAVCFVIRVMRMTFEPEEDDVFLNHRCISLLALHDLWSCDFDDWQEFSFNQQ